MSEVRYGTNADRLWGRRVSQLVGPAPVDVETPTTGELAGSCDLTFGAGSSALAGTAATLTATCALIFGHGASAIGGAGELLPDPGTAGTKMTFGTLVIYLDGGGALVGTNAAVMLFTCDGALATGGAMAGAADLVFGHAAAISSEQAFETPILIMARSLA